METVISVFVIIWIIRFLAEWIVDLGIEACGSVLLLIGEDTVERECSGEPFCHIKAPFVAYVEPVLLVVVESGVVIFVVYHEIVSCFVRFIAERQVVLLYHLSVEHIVCDILCVVVLA